MSDGTVSSVGTGVSLSESRGSTTSNGVESWWGGSITLARSERVVGLVEVSNGHDELTSHDIELVLTHQSGGRVLRLGGTDSETELVVRDERHPLRERQRGSLQMQRGIRTDLLVEDVFTRDIGSDVTTDGVSDGIRSVGVKLSSRISLGLGLSARFDLRSHMSMAGETYNVHRGTVPETVNLDVVRRLDEVGSGDGSIGDKTERCEQGPCDF